MSIVVTNLVKRFSGKTILGGIDLDLAAGEFTYMLGPSGCGKTTALRCIAGLETPDEGAIRIGDHVVFDSAKGINVPSYERNLGMVFQSYAIWPHMTVFENVAFPLRVRRRPKAEAEASVVRALGMVGLDEFRDRSVHQLSGGQQQRVAVARAMVHSPSAMLLDEPLNNLDARLRDQTRAEIRTLQRKLAVVTVYVTHDQSEALSLSDRILVMNSGKIIEEGSPADIYNRPRHAFVAEVMGPTNFISTDLLEPESAAKLAPLIKEAEPLQNGNPMLLVRPDKMRIAAAEAANAQELPEIRLQGAVAQRLFLGSHYEYHVSSGGSILRIFSAMAIDEGANVVAAFAPADCWAVQ